jgi:hypothetical protein
MYLFVKLFYQSTGAAIMIQANTQKNQADVTPSALSGTKEKHFIEDELFKKLLAIREDIYQKTEINVSPRKLVNMLLKQSDFEVLRDQLIQQYL